MDPTLFVYIVVELGVEPAELFANARRVVVVTGAGVSAASGVPTYRAAGSRWDDQRLERMSHANAYGNHLVVLWGEMWGPLRALMTAAEPNPAHLALARWQTALEAAGGSLLVATQNIDGLHTRAGSSGVAELHGSMSRSRCIRCKAVTDDVVVPGPGRSRCAGRA